MSISRSRDDLERDKFVESSDVTGQAAIAVVNPDGTNISGGSGGGAGTEVDDGQAVDTDTNGRLIFGADAIPGNAYAVKVDTDGHLQVDVLTGGGSGTEFDDGDAIDTDSQGKLLIGTTGVPGTARAVRVEDDGAVHVSDGGDSLTVDGTVAATQSGTWDINNISGTISLPTGAATAANQLPDGHNVTVDNGAGASAVNVQDGGNSLTVDGTVAATQSGAWSVGVTGSLPLPTGAATETTLAALAAEDFATQTTLAAINAKFGTIGQQNMAGSAAVVLASNQSAIPVTQSGTWNITNISGTVSLPTGAATSANQLPDGHNVTVDNASGAAAVNIQDGGNSITVDGTVAATQSGTWNLNNISGTISLPTGAATAANQTSGNASLSAIQTSVQIIDDWDESDRAKVNPIVGQAGVAAGLGATSASTQRVVLANDSPVPTPSQTATTVSESNVPVTTSSTTLIASNASRKRLTIQNHGSGYVRVSLSATATLTSPIRLVPAVGAWVIEGNFIYRGAVSAISESGTNNVGVIQET